MRSNLSFSIPNFFEFIMIFLIATLRLKFSMRLWRLFNHHIFLLIFNELWVFIPIIIKDSVLLNKALILYKLRFFQLKFTHVRIIVLEIVLSILLIINITLIISPILLIRLGITIRLLIFSIFKSWWSWIIVRYGSNSVRWILFCSFTIIVLRSNWTSLLLKSINEIKISLLFNKFIKILISLKFQFILILFRIRFVIMLLLIRLLLHKLWKINLLLINSIWPNDLLSFTLQWWLIVSIRLINSVFFLFISNNNLCSFVAIESIKSRIPLILLYYWSFSESSNNIILNIFCLLLHISQF